MPDTDGEFDVAFMRTADVSVFGPINGRGERDLSGAYLGLFVSGKGFAHRFRISLGAAEVLLAELSGLVGEGAHNPLPPSNSLILAAPDMLEALKAFAAPGQPVSAHVIEMARDAIAKAEA